MNLTTRINRVLLRFHPDPHVREAARERARRARERAQDPEWMRMLSEELRAQASLAARLDAEEAQRRRELAERPVAIAGQDRVARIEAERQRAEDALLPTTWKALESSAAVRTEQQLQRHHVAVLARAGVRPETVTEPAVAGGVVAAAAQEVQEGHLRYGMRCAGWVELPLATTVVVTASALDAVALTQLRPDGGAACVSVGARLDGTTIHEVRRMLEEAQARLRAVRPDARLTVTLAFASREEAQAELVRGVVPDGAVVERSRAPESESWSAQLAKVEHDLIRRHRARAPGHVRGLSI